MLLKLVQNIEESEFMWAKLLVHLLLMENN